MFNVPAELLAAECAAKLNAAKIIFFTDGQTMIDSRTGFTVQSLRHTQAAALLESIGIDSLTSPIETVTTCTTNINGTVSCFTDIFTDKHDSIAVGSMNTALTITTRNHSQYDQNNNINLDACPNFLMYLTR